MPWRKGPYSLYASISIPNGDPTGNGSASCRTVSDLTGRTILDVAAAAAITLADDRRRRTSASVSIPPSCSCASLKRCVSCSVTTSGRICCRWASSSCRAGGLRHRVLDGVLYHRRSAVDHLWQLKDQLGARGRAVLETPVVEGDENTVLVPGDRYAQMRNVYFIPRRRPAKCGWRSAVY